MCGPALNRTNCRHDPGQRAVHYRPAPASRRHRSDHPCAVACFSCLDRDRQGAHPEPPTRSRSRPCATLPASCSSARSSIRGPGRESCAPNRLGLQCGRALCAWHFATICVFSALGTHAPDPGHLDHLHHAADRLGAGRGRCLASGSASCWILAVLAGFAGVLLVTRPDRRRAACRGAARGGGGLPQRPLLDRDARAGCDTIWPRRPCSIPGSWARRSVLPVLPFVWASPPRGPGLAPAGGTGCVRRARGTGS